MEDKEILVALKFNDKKIFENIYDTYSNELLNFIVRFTKDKQTSEDILHEIFMDLWNRRQTLEIKSNFKNYLYSSAKYAVLTYVRSEKVKQKYAEHFNLFLAQTSLNSTYDISDLSDLNNIISLCLEKLPKKCREAFYLSRFKHKSIQEIAIEMNISTRTVENYITIGIKTIRKALESYSWLLLIFNNFIRF